jgi:nucleotide-binding universal stress UspA family protein
VGLGGTPFAKVATRRAVELAIAHRAELVAATLVDLGRYDDHGLYPTGAAAELMEWRDAQVRVTLDALEHAVFDFETACRKAGVSQRVLWETGEPLDQLVTAARYQDLVICGLRGLFDYGLMAEPKDSLVRLIRHGVQPILAAADEYRGIGRVMIAYSGSPESACAMKSFIQIGAWPRCELCIATFDRAPQRAESLLSSAAAYCRAHGYEPQLRHDTRPAKSAILECARDWRADLIVMGDGAHGVIARRILGDTLLHVVRNADRPLFLAH